MTLQQKSSLSIRPLNIAATTSISDVFEQFSNQAWAMLLDSADSLHQDGQFDIFVANPVATITTSGGQTTITKPDNSVTQNQDDPINLLQELIDSYIPQDISTSNENSLPFMAGALGYFGYDLGRQFETLAEADLNEYNTPDMAVGIYTWSVIKDRKSAQFYLCSLDSYPHPSIAQIEQSNTCLPPTRFSLTSPWQANMTKQQYQQKIAKIHDYLTAGDCYQINLAQRFSAQYQGDEWQAYQQLRSENQAPFSAFIRLPESCILSISPERFISVKGKNVQTKPIKGTRPRSTDIIQDQEQIEQLLSSEKDKAENLMIVDLLRNDLSKHCTPGSVKVPELFKIESFKAVHHLVSTVTGELKSDSSALDLLKGAFPGGSITGAPKIRAMQIIDELEPNNRNIYCGSIGYLGIQGDMDTSICIRTLLCEADRFENAKSEKSTSPKNAKVNHIYCWAGGGIVIDSVATDEYQESLDKVSRILPVLE
ncbi:aminodeoxychorismate synthase component I [Paraglaciecola aquimarina]|uniref:aminodeoxychorismate synthase n=1 Tax=Paraglaciecola algarum TaxID=3050085 RepID=A0ABS9D3I4_9ALTE|nr:aminodeoxychorismate synthase component I [Paraglaciecola sp. G1-23]MCF2946597.1 aminodeoxychorismate synthase component I [Paraglaciecola sp. G1-23]